jgi:hypothetical protein
MKAKITRVEQTDGLCYLTIDCDAIREIENVGEFEPCSIFDAPKGGVEFMLRTNEIFKVGDTFEDGEWVACESAEKPSENMKSFDSGKQQADMLKTWGEKFGGR